MWVWKMGDSKCVTLLVNHSHRIYIRNFTNLLFFNPKNFVKLKESEENMLALPHWIAVNNEMSKTRTICTWQEDYKGQLNRWKLIFVLKTSRCCNNKSKRQTILNVIVIKTKTITIQSNIPPYNCVNVSIDGWAMGQPLENTKWADLLIFVHRQ